MRVDLQPGYILHRRPYRDSSALLEVFTAEYGRLGLVARGARRAGPRGSKSALLQPFQPLLLSFAGRGELKTLGSMEAAGGYTGLRGQRMYCGLYLNELLVRLLHRNDAHPRLFAAYADALYSLAQDVAIDAHLRRFELVLIDELGYRLDLACEGVTGTAIAVDGWYRYEVDAGLVTARREHATGRLYPGAHLLAMAAGQFEGEVAGTAKLLLREALAAHLGGAPLRSRDLFRYNADPDTR